MTRSYASAWRAGGGQHVIYMCQAVVRIVLFRAARCNALVTIPRVMFNLGRGFSPSRVYNTYVG